METSEEEEVEHLLKAAPLVVGAGSVATAGIEIKFLGGLLGDHTKHTKGF